jgi:hypothetical protein
MIHFIEKKKKKKNLFDDSFLYFIGSTNKPFKTMMEFKYQVDCSASKFINFTS